MIRLVWGDPASNVWFPLSTDFSDVGDAGVEITDAGERGGLLAREWTRSENGTTVQRMLELRWTSGDVLGVVRGDSEPSGHLDDDEVRRLAALVKGRLS